MNIGYLYFFKDTKPVDKMQPLANQCQKGDTLFICQLHKYLFQWKATRRSITYYTNLKLEYLAYAMYREFKIPPTEYNKYRLKTKTQNLSLEELIPFEGISDEIEITELQRI